MLLGSVDGRERERERERERDPSNYPQHARTMSESTTPPVPFSLEAKKLWTDSSRNIRCKRFEWVAE